VDHLSRDIFDCRASNLIVTTARGNAQNRLHGPFGLNINAYKNSFCVHVYIGGQLIFQPSFLTVDKAKQCRSEYLQIADDVEKGLRAMPLKLELKSISDHIRSAS
jgi:hypothetical protein